MTIQTAWLLLLGGFPFFIWGIVWLVHEEERRLGYRPSSTWSKPAPKWDCKEGQPWPRD